MSLIRLIVVAAGLVLPLAAAGTAQAAPQVRHHSAHVRTATYHRPHHHHHRMHAAAHRTPHYAMAHRHSIVRGS